MLFPPAPSALRRYRQLQIYTSASVPSETFIHLLCVSSLFSLSSQTYHSSFRLLTFFVLRTQAQRSRRVPGFYRQSRRAGRLQGPARGAQEVRADRSASAFGGFIILARTVFHLLRFPGLTRLRGAWSVDGGLIELFAVFRGVSALRSSRHGLHDSSTYVRIIRSSTL